MMYGLDLFSGYGGISLALKDYVRPVVYCEIERYAQGILLSQISRGSLPFAPIWDDVSTLRGDDVGSVDIIYGGFPCQDISVAGNGDGLGGKRSGLFFELLRLVEEIRPPWVFLENVPAIKTRGLLTVVRSFTDLRYDCRWTRVSAQEVGANHIRERWFLLAHANSERLERQRQESSGIESELQNFSNLCGWEVEPGVGRVANGVTARLDRVKALGNGVVPLQAKIAFERIMGIELEAGDGRG
jgi:DNA (cytosine-5)-methyltransferase 1